MHNTYVLDAFALLAFLQGEPGSQTVTDIIADEETRVLMSVINLGEVFYVVFRTHGKEKALALEKMILESRKPEIVAAPWERIRAAATIKALGGLSLADCFAAALTEESGGILVTGDPEFRRLEEKGTIRVLWLPSS